MLVLTRQAGESIIISDNIEVTVLETKGNQVRLGIKAPENIIIMRPEAKNKLPTNFAQPSSAEATVSLSS